MSESPNTPQVTKGAIVGLDIFNPVAAVVVFQYNPESLSRKIEPAAPASRSRAEARNLNGAPVEEITIEKLVVDATDQLEENDQIARDTGIGPRLASLEMLLYPKSIQVIANTVLLAAGSVEMIPSPGPLTVFIWGWQKIVPVRVTSFTIAEQEFSTELNPVRAEVRNLKMRVLSYNDLSVADPAYWLFLGHQIIKETLATIGSIDSIPKAEGVS